MKDYIIIKKILKNFNKDEWSGIIGLLLAFLFMLYALFSEGKSFWE
jgi:hypothetical protein